MSLAPLIPGAQWTARLRYVSGTAYVPSAHRVLLVIDSPSNPTPQLRLSKVFNPAGGSDTGASADGNDVLFTFAPDETAEAVGYGGQWTVYTFVGDADGQSYLVPTTTDKLRVISPAGGVVPHA